MSRIAALLVLATAASLGVAAVACGSSSGGSGAPCATDAATTFDAMVDTGPDVQNGTDAGLVCEAGSIPSMGHCMNVAGSLVALRWELPCTGPGGPTFCPTQVDGGDVQVVSATLGGTTGQTYAVTLHVRGVAEKKAYVEDEAGAAPQTAGAEGLANAQQFVSGGVPDNSSSNIYELQVSDPPGVYFLNSGVSSIQYTWWVDYSVTIPIKGGATVTMTANAVDNIESANNNGVDGGPVLVPGVPPYPQAYDGQFMQLDVDSVVEMP